jgi:hypothetical protein
LQHSAFRWVWCLLLEFLDLKSYWCNPQSNWVRENLISLCTMHAPWIWTLSEPCYVIQLLL